MLKIHNNTFWIHNHLKTKNVYNFASYLYFKLYNQSKHTILIVAKIFCRHFTTPTRTGLGLSFPFIKTTKFSSLKYYDCCYVQRASSIHGMNIMLFGYTDYLSAALRSVVIIGYSGGMPKRVFEWIFHTKNSTT